MPAGGGTEPDSPEFEDITVEEQRKFPPMCGRLNRMGQIADQVRHRILLELGEIYQRTLEAGVEKDTVRGCPSL